MGESNFSKQVCAMVPAIQAFPISEKTHDDRLFKTVSFPVDGEPIIRLRYLDINWMSSPVLIQKTISLNDWDPEKDRLRVKAFLSTPIDGIYESEWVTNDRYSYDNARDYNQIRMRGVSKEGIISDWVYSGAKDIDNHPIIFELIYDLLETLDSLADDKIEFILEHLLHDAFQTLLKSDKPVFSYHSNNTEQFIAKLAEIQRLLAKNLSHDFHEKVFTSVSEFSELVKSYHLFDRFSHGENDFLYLLLESYLEEHLEHVIQKTEIEVMTTNSEEIGLLLQGIFDFDIKNEMISLLHHLQPNDAFVTLINDAVQLITDPKVSDVLTVKTYEEVSSFFKMALQDLFSLFYLMEQQFIDFSYPVEDKFEPNIDSHLVHYELSQDEQLYQYMLLYELLSNLMDDKPATIEDYQIYLLDLLSELFINKEKIQLYLAIDPVEAIDYLLSVKEHFYSAWKKWEDTHQETSSIQFKEASHMLNQKVLSNYNESQINGLKDQLTLQSLEQKLSLTQDYSISKRDRINVINKQTDVSNNDQYALRFNETSAKKFLQNTMVDAIIKNIVFFERADHQWLAAWINFANQIITGIHDSYFNQFLMYPNDHMHARVSDRQDFDLCPDLEDQYTINGHEVVQYILGDVNGPWPLGTFVLGQSTLIGQDHQ